MDWFRMYHEARKDAKLALLSDAQHRVWFNLMCLAGEQPERGVIIGVEPFELACEVARGDEELLQATLDFLVKARILAIADDGTLSFLNWRKRQYIKPSDEPERVAERVAKHRAKKRAEQGTPSGEESTDVTPLDDVQGICNAPVTRGNANSSARDRVQTSEVRTQNGERTETERASAPPPATKPSPLAFEIAETLKQAPWVGDDLDIVAAKIDESVRKCEWFDLARDGPLLALSFVNWRGYRKKPPSLWYSAWLNWLRKERDNAERTPNRAGPTDRRSGHDPASQIGRDPADTSADDAYLVGPFRRPADATQADWRRDRSHSGADRRDSRAAADGT